MTTPTTSQFLKYLMPLALLFVSMPGTAAVFNVTSTWCTGADSIVEAIDNANVQPGVDTISIQPGLAISFNTCPITDLSPYAGQVQESVIIEGNGATLQGEQSWIDLGGNLNREGCPSEIAGTITINTSPGFLSIGNKGADNSAIEVTINHLTANDLSAFAKVYEGAQLALTEIQLIDIQDAINDCSRGAVEGYPSSSISVVNSTIHDFKNYGTSLAKNVWNAALVTANGSLYVKNSQFSKKFPGVSGGALYASSSDVTVVSSRFFNAGGLSFIGNADAPSQVSIVNSAIQIEGDTKQTDRIYAGFYSDVEFHASTIVSLFGACTNCPPDDSQTMPLYADGGRFHLSETAIGVWGDTIPGALLFAERGGGYTADPLTYVQPVAGQDAASLRALTGQAGLLTDPPALPGDATGLTLVTPADAVKWITPIAPGVLIDQVTNAGAGDINQLLDPFDGSVITKDVFGNERVDTNGSRNIGAVQLSLAPSLHAVSGDGLVTLDWTRPQEPNVGSITGYDLCHTEAGVACTTWIPVTGDPATLTLTITQLNDGTSLVNGNKYDFIVRARYGPPLVGPFGPESNLASQTPFGAVEPPVLTAIPGDGEVTLNWTKPADGGHGLSGYAVWYRINGFSYNAPWPFVQGGDTLQTIVTGLNNGLEWEFLIRAITPDSFSSGVATAVATPWPVANLSYATPVTVSENSLVSIPPNVSNLSQTPLYVIQSGLLPSGLTLNNTTGEISGEPDPGSAATYNLTVLLSQASLPSVFDVTADLVIEVVSTLPDLSLRYPGIDVTAGTGPLDITPTVTGTQAGTLSFAIDSVEVLPAGLALDPLTGRITGVPTTATNGFQGLSIEVTEQLDEGQRLAVSPLVVRVRPTLDYDPVDAEVGDFITITPTVSSSAVPGSFMLDDGNLPVGLSLDPATGIISGIPELPEFAVVTITFTMTGGQQEKVSADLGISVTNYTIDFSYPQQTFTIGQRFSLLPTVSGTKGATVYTVDGGLLPAGLTLNPNTGEVSGIMTGELNGTIQQIKLTDQFSSARAVAVLQGEAFVAVPALGPYSNLLLVLLALGLGFASLRRMI